MGQEKQVVIHKVWRSEIERVVVLLLLCVASVILSHYFPGTIITGELITIDHTQFDLKLPLFSLMPVVAFMDLIARVYDVRYVLDARGIESREGIVSFSQRISRVRFEDIRLVEFDQTLLERFLEVGDIKIGTAATGDVEIFMEGIEAPKEVQAMIQAERDIRQQLEESDHNIRETAQL
ncbi:MAG: PH domain-containing protein [Oligoflexia bacterium]|nr:PH domain-containing protein [Oligoflexia bacterium]